MGILANTRQGGRQIPGRWVMIPKGMASPKSRRARVVQRRRRVFQRLLIAAAVSFFIGIIPPLRVVWLAHAVIDLALAGYVFQLRRWRTAEIERARVVRTLPASQPAGALPVVEAADEEPDETPDVVIQSG